MKPTRDKNGLPMHSDECPGYDGKRCGQMCFRPDRFCEPALIDMANALRDIAEGDCSYGDGCPTSSSARHGMCLRCLAAAGLGYEP